MGWENLKVSVGRAFADDRLVSEVMRPVRASLAVKDLDQFREPNCVRWETSRLNSTVLVAGRLSDGRISSIRVGSGGCRQSMASSTGSLYWVHCQGMRMVGILPEDSPDTHIDQAM